MRGLGCQAALAVLSERMFLAERRATEGGVGRWREGWEQRRAGQGRGAPRQRGAGSGAGRECGQGGAVLAVVPVFGLPRQAQKVAVAGMAADDGRQDESPAVDRRRGVHHRPVLWCQPLLHRQR